MKTVEKYFFLSGLLLCFVVLFSVISLVRVITLIEMWLLLLLFLLVSFGWLKRTSLYGKVALAMSLSALIAVLLLNPIFLFAVVLVGCSVLLFWIGVFKWVKEHYRKAKEHRELTTTITQQFGQVKTRNWWQSDRLNETYEWDNIHLISLFGDTTIDLSKTILPEDTSIIVIHKGFGDVRIIVPLGIGISLSHNTLKGSVLFEQEAYRLSHEQLRVYSPNYVSSNRKLKIVTTVYIGNLEVIRL